MFMRILVPLIVVWLGLVPCPSAEAQPAPQGDEDVHETDAPEQPTAPEQPEPVEHDIIPLFAGDTAPWSGLLVPELQFTEYLQLQFKLDEAQGILDVRTHLMEEQRTIYETAMHEVARPCAESWWETYGFTVGIVGGIIMGVGLTVLGVWAAGQL